MLILNPKLGGTVELNARQVYDVLKGKGVDYLYHANSVQTSCTFLKNAYLMSRGTVKARGFRQTTQDSDSIDQKFGVWFDVFVDTVDIHNRASKRNVYGPVLMKIKLEILATSDMPPLWVTKKNPTKWIDGEDLSNRWYTSIVELQKQLIKGEFDQMIVFRHIGGTLPIKNHVTDLILDDPNQEYCGLKFYDLAAGALISAANESEMPIKIYKRTCNTNCICQKEYSLNPNLILKHFFP